jgi:hypothetical protein
LDLEKWFNLSGNYTLSQRDGAVKTQQVAAVNASVIDATQDIVIQDQI